MPLTLRVSLIFRYVSYTTAAHHLYLRAWWHTYRTRLDIRHTQEGRVSVRITRSCQQWSLGSMITAGQSTLSGTTKYYATQFGEMCPHPCENRWKMSAAISLPLSLLPLSLPLSIHPLSLSLSTLSPSPSLSTLSPSPSPRWCMMLRL